MSSTMTSRERFARMFAHQEADRVPIIDGPWGSTIERWQREGLPADVPWEEYFGTDRITMLGVDTSPRFPNTVIEETEDYRIETSAWGVTMKNWKHAGSVPEFLDFTIIDMDSWRAAWERMEGDDDNRIPWDWLKAQWPEIQRRGDWIAASLWFGFDITHSWMVGTERVLEAMVDNPEWLQDIFEKCLTRNLALFDRVWDAGFRFDSIFWCDDMGYKGHPFFSPAMYRRLVKPYHARAIEWAHAKGIYAHLHSCGNVMELLPDLLDIGLDALNPIEVKAGMDPVHIKQLYGDRLVLHGGINAVLWDKPEKIEAEMRRVLPVVKQNGGYIFASDHSVPDSVGLEDFRRIVALAKELGSY